MYRYAARIGPMVVALLLACAAVYGRQQSKSAATPPNAESEEAVVKQVVDGIMQPFLVENKAPGAIVGVSLHGHRYFFTYGKATDAGASFTPGTLVEIGSCTKTFTTTLFALAIDRNQIDPQAPAQKYMPDEFTLRPGAQAMTPLELADFTSGLPSDPSNMPRVLEQRGIEHYTTKDFLTWISHWTPETKLPAPYFYSNSGIGLLGYLVMKATGASWEDQLASEILRPLGMPDTTLRPSPEQGTRLARGHTANGQDAPSWPIYAWYAAGGLRSTARDMLSFGEANLGHNDVNAKKVPAELTAAMKLAQQPIYTMPDSSNKVAMAWIHNMGAGNPNLHPVIVKDGATAGFGATILINPGKDLAIFTAVNQRDSPMAKSVEIARHIPDSPAKAGQGQPIVGRD